MFKFNRTVQDAEGNAITSGTISVWDANTGQSTLADIFSDNGVTPKANPFALPSTGLVEFYIANERFDITTVTSNGTLVTEDLIGLDHGTGSGLNADLLDGFSSDKAATADTVAVRDAGGVLKVGTPVAVGDASNKGWVMDNVVGIEQPRADVASATSIDLTPSVTGTRYVRITGTTQIDAVTVPDGLAIEVLFADSLILQNSATLILEGGENITTQAGDLATFRGDPSGVTRVKYKRVNIKPSNGLFKRTEYTSGSGTFTKDAKTTHLRVLMCAAGGGGGGARSISGTGSASAGGGAAGETLEVWIAAPSASYSYAVAVGGIAGVGSTPTNGGTGGDTTFGTFTAKGGLGGGSANSTGTAVSGTGGSIQESSDTGTRRYPGTNGQAGQGIPSGKGGASHFSPSVAGVVDDNVGLDGADKGGGASGGCATNTTRNGGVGAGGFIIVEEYIF